MIPFRYGAPIAILLAAGCGSTPKEASNIEAAPTPVAVDAAQAANVTEEAEPTVLEVSASDADPGHRVTCREMLKPGSNVVVTRCLSGDDWKIYERARELWAQEMLRTIQGGAYR